MIYAIEPHGEHCTVRRFKNLQRRVALEWAEEGEGRELYQMPLRWKPDLESKPSNQELADQVRAAGEVIDVDRWSQVPADRFSRLLIADLRKPA